MGTRECWARLLHVPLFSGVVVTSIRRCSELAWRSVSGSVILVFATWSCKLDRALPRTGARTSGVLWSKGVWRLYSNECTSLLGAVLCISARAPEFKLERRGWKKTLSSFLGRDFNTRTNWRQGIRLCWTVKLLCTVVCVEMCTELLVPAPVCLLPVLKLSCSSKFLCSVV